MTAPTNFDLLGPLPTGRLAATSTGSSTTGVLVPAPSYPLLDHLAAQDRDARLDRLRRAVTEFDAATITTIHGFATQVLSTLGITSGADPDATMVDDSAQLAAECCADVLAAAAMERDDLPTSKILVNRTRTAINIPDLRLAPGADRPAAHRAGAAVDRPHARPSPGRVHAELRRRAGRAATRAG